MKEKESASNRPEEIFGYPVANGSDRASGTRRKQWCPFENIRCGKKSRLLNNYPFGVCSVRTGSATKIICPRRFQERGTLSDVPLVLEDVANHYFGDTNNTVYFPEVRLPNIGSVDYVIVKHRPMRPEVEDFVSVEFQSDSTTGTGALVKAFREFLGDEGIEKRNYRFGVNTYDSLKRALTQLMNKGMVYESWGTKCYWVIQEYLYENLAERYGLGKGSYQTGDGTRLALYALQDIDGRLSLRRTRVLSTTVDELYQAMRNNPRMPAKDAFVAGLNRRLELQLGLREPS